MICNRENLLKAAPIKDMYPEKIRQHGVSFGLAEAGYDIRLKQEVTFNPHHGQIAVSDSSATALKTYSRFTIASAMEEFDMPNDLMGIVHDKSTWARKGLSVFNTVIEPGWKGFLTLELIYNGDEEITLPAGCGIAQVIFHRLEVPNGYKGKYQNQQDKPVASIFESYA